MKSGKQQRNLSPKDAKSSSPSALPSSNDLRWILAVCVFLALMVWVVFGQTLHFSFVNYDDDTYIYKNPAITHGLTPRSAAQAFSYDVTDNWVPLTTLSHLLDWQFYGADAGGHHLTNVVLQAVASIVLFLVLYQMTTALETPSSSLQLSAPKRKALWCSAFVAAVFAIHPLRAESVAWVTERKDVLCGVFFMLTLWAYLGYVRHSRSPWRYLLTLLLFALALMSKPMVVTLPFILLLLDYWPLQRFNALRLPRLLIEKVPFLLLSIASCIPTFIAEKPDIAAGKKFAVSLQIENALVSCADYIWQIFYPARLAVLYPFPYQGVPLLEVAGSLALLIVISLAVFHWRQKYPYLLVGWLWYLVMLMPVIGVMQLGDQARADRFTYFPHIGLYVLLTWLVADLVARFHWRRFVLTSLSSLILVALAYEAHIQTSYWQNSKTLWKHTLSCTSANPTAHLNLGVAFETDGRLDDAIAQFKQALEIDPDCTLANFNFGNVLAQQGHLDDAIAQYQEALKLNQGDPASDDCNQLGLALFKKGQPDNAVMAYQKALEFNPNNVATRINLAQAMVSKGRLEDAAAQYLAGLKIEPDNPDCQSSIAATIWILAKYPQANGNEILTLIKNANQLSGGKNPMMLRALAAAYARCGQFQEAVETGNQALALAADDQSSGFANTLEQEIALYQAGTPLPLINQTNTKNER